MASLFLVATVTAPNVVGPFTLPKVSGSGPNPSGGNAGEGAACFANGLDWILFMNDNSDLLNIHNNDYLKGNVPSNYSYLSSSDGLSWSKHTFYTVPLTPRKSSYPPPVPTGVVALCEGDQIYALYSTDGGFPPSSALLYSRGTMTSTGTIVWSVLNQVIAKADHIGTGQASLTARRIVLDSGGNPWVSADQAFWQNNTLFIWEEVSGAWIPRYYTPAVITGGTDSIVPVQSGNMGLVYYKSSRFVGVIWNGTAWGKGIPSPPTVDPNRVSITSSRDAIDVSFSSGHSAAGVYFISLSMYNGSWSTPKKLVDLYVGPGCSTGALSCYSDLATSADSTEIVIFYTLTVGRTTTNEVDYCLSTSGGSDWSCGNHISYPEIEAKELSVNVYDLGANPTSNQGAFSLTWKRSAELRYARLLEPTPKLGVIQYSIIAGSILLLAFLLAVGIGRWRKDKNKPM